MYPVSDAFLQAIESNSRKYHWSGTITTVNGVSYPFENKDIVKGSGYITRQCCSSTEIELVRSMLLRWVSAFSLTSTATPWTMQKSGYIFI